MEKITYIEAISQAMREEMQADPSVFILGEDVGQFGGAFKVTKGFLEEFGPERVMDTPISESAIVGVGVGAALFGMKPICEMQFMDFITSGFNMIVNVAAKFHWRLNSKVPMVIRGPSGGGTSGGPFHSQNPEGWFTQVPGLKVVCPATAIDAKGLLKAAIRDPNPVLYFEHKFLYRRIKEIVPQEDYITPIGVAALRREGADVSIITWSAMVWAAIEAAEELSRQGIEAEILDLRSLLPYDKEAIVRTVKKTGKALVLYEASLTHGPGSEIAAFISSDCFEHLDGPVKRLASADTPTPYARSLEAAFMPTSEKIVKAVKELAEY